MSSPDLPDSGLPDSGMASGSDAGEPGEHLGPADLEPDERRLLAALTEGVGEGGQGSVDAFAEVRAAEDEAPLPAEGGAPDDGLTARFTAPPEPD